MGTSAFTGGWSMSWTRQLITNEISD
jgi:hypothetical protein